MDQQQTQQSGEVVQTYKSKYPFLQNLMLADNDFHYVDDQGNRTDEKINPEELIRKIRERRHIDLCNR